MLLHPFKSLVHLLRLFVPAFITDGRSRTWQEPRLRTRVLHIPSPSWSSLCHGHPDVLGTPFAIAILLLSNLFGSAVLCLCIPSWLWLRQYAACVHALSVTFQRQCSCHRHLAAVQLRDSKLICEHERPVPALTLCLPSCAPLGGLSWCRMLRQ